MSTSSRWIAGVVGLVLLTVVFFATADRPGEGTRASVSLLSMGIPVPPAAGPILGVCPSIPQRVEFERGDCLQSTRHDLISGEIGLEAALRRLEGCTVDRPELESLARRRAEIRADRLAARMAFGDELDPAEREELERIRSDLELPARSISPQAVARLRAAGITADGFDASPARGLVARLASVPSLRVDFRNVFGDRLGDDLEGILGGGSTSPVPAVALGGTVLVPNFVEPAAPGGAASPGPDGPIIVATDAYASRTIADLRRLELDRRSLIATASLEHQRTGSIRDFVSSARRLGTPDEETLRIREEGTRDRDVLLRRYAGLEWRLGVDPLLGRMAGESVSLVAAVDEGCATVAGNRRRWIRTGAGTVTALLGAAGAVVAAGATGTFYGGLVIAAALEASVGAYLIARSEQVAHYTPATVRRDVVLPVDLDERRFARQASAFDLGEGNVGAEGREQDAWSPEFGEGRDEDSTGGESVEEEENGYTGALARENTIPPILPVDVPDELRELPPLLASHDLRQMRDLTLPEIQERLDEFLALTDLRSWAELAESDEPLEPLSLEEMIEEARRSLKQWEQQRELSERFGGFFIQAELEGISQARRGEVLLSAMGRYYSDRAALRDSRDVEDLRRRVGARLVTHCRAGDAAGDLILTACRNDTALSMVLVASIRDAGVSVPPGTILGVQAVANRFQAVLYSRDLNQVFSLNNGRLTQGVVGPIYHPAVFFAGYLESHGIVPEIDANRHLLVALPDRPMGEDEMEEECTEADQTSVVGRAVRWIGSTLGVRGNPRDDGCGTAAPGGGARNQPSGVNVDISIPRPRNPLARAGGGQSGSGQGGSGSSGGSEGSAGSSGAGAAGGDDSPGAAGQEGDGGAGGQGGSATEGLADGSAAAGAGAAGAEAGAEGAAGGAGGDSRSATGGTGSGGSSGEPSTAAASRDSRGTGGTGGFGVGDVAGGGSPTDLSRIGREAIDVSVRSERSGGLRVTAWRLRADEGMASGATSGVLYADNQRALDRFGPNDPFITLAPAEVEAQRRMQDADAYPIFSANTECGAANLPPRRVFRRAATTEAGFRYVYCDQHETMVVFRDRKDAQSYAALKAPDRPLYLAKLAAERLELFERSPEIRRLDAFLADPNVLRGYTREQVYAMAKAAGDLLVFQNTLESALVQSMNELGPTAIRTYYFDMHRQVLQAPLFVRLAERAHRLNQRLASDPLQSLAWANAQPRLARQGFFELYHHIGGMMEWPERWATLQQRYGASTGPVAMRDPGAASLDFLQILSDPQRVRVDWTAERTSQPAIRDRQAQDGAARSAVVRQDPTLSEREDLQEVTEHLRGGTGGFGDSGDGDSIGPESGRRPLQMIHIRVVPEDGDPDRKRLPDDNQVRPGGTAGQTRKQTEESSSRQEPLLWVTPQTFVEAALSTWDRRDLDPSTAGRVPPILRLNQRLREVYMRELRPSGVYDNRLRSAMEVFTAGGWLRYAEVREAMGGSWVSVRARDTGRFSAAFSGNAPINDQDQIRIPNFFGSTGVVLPADLYEPVREHYSRAILGIFDLGREARVPDAVPLRALPVPPGDEARSDRQNVLRSLETLREQAAEE